MPEQGDEPSVSVIVPVYNTLPYLIDCLDSLVNQTIASQIEVVAVDDGSTDGSAAVLDEYAARHPELFTVLHQANSGGPAAPCNRGLERARGRYVYFLGADDYLALDALEGLVDAADTWGSDIAFGKAVGVNGRYVWQPIFAETNPDLDLYDSLLPYSVSNSKMFRRSLVEEHRLRFPEDLRIGSDQPFTIEAMVNARKISVLGDRVYLYGTRRDNASNITFSAHALDRLLFVTRIMGLVAELLEPGPRRDALLTRHFHWELAKLVGPAFLESDEQTQRELCEGVAPLCDAYLTARILERLPVAVRVRLELARRGEVERLLETIAAEQSETPVDLGTDGRHLLHLLPGLDGEAPLPSELYRVRRPLTLSGVERPLEVRRLRWRGPAPDRNDAVPVLVVGVSAPIRLIGDSVPSARLVLVDGTTELGGWSARVAPEDGALLLQAEVSATDLAKAASTRPASLRLRIDLADAPVDVLLALDEPRKPVQLDGGRLLVRPGTSGRATVRLKPTSD